VSGRPQVRFKRLRPGAVLPRYMSARASGMDLSAAADEEITLAPQERAGVPTGWAMELPPGFEGQVRPRSGLSSKHGVTVVNAPGTIDNDYRGELVVLLVNLGREPYTVAPRDRIAQLVVAPVVQAEVIEADELTDTSRGSGGFGSSGR
jgi:dUTP pyrophosphatase